MAAEDVLIIGGGPVAQSLGQGLREAGLRVRVWRRSAGPLWGQGETPRGVPVVLVAVRDDAIAAAAAQLLEPDPGLWSGSVLLHCAGSLPPDEAFAAQQGQVAGRGLLHPLRSITGVIDLSGCVLAITGDPRGVAEASRLAALLRARPLVLRPDQLAAYHGAAVMAAGHVAALLDAAVAVLQDLGLPRRQAEEALAALCRSVADNIAREGLPAALTGPVARGDVATVRRHLQALPAEAGALYRALLPRALQVAQQKGGASDAALAAMAALLTRPDGG